MKTNPRTSDHLRAALATLARTDAVSDAERAEFAQRVAEQRARDEQGTDGPQQRLELAA